MNDHTAVFDCIDIISFHASHGQRAAGRSRFLQTVCHTDGSRFDLDGSFTDSGNSSVFVNCRNRLITACPDHILIGRIAGIAVDRKLKFFALIQLFVDRYAVNLE